MKKYIIPLMYVCIFLMPQLLSGKILLEFNHTEIPEQDTAIYKFTFTLSENGSNIILNLKSNLRNGALNVWFGGGGYDVIGNYTDEGQFEYNNLIFGPLNSTEPITVSITATDAVGDWAITFTEFSRSKALVSVFVAGILMIIVCVAFIIVWKKNTGSSYKWLYIGAGVWVVGVTLKFLFAYAFNTPILKYLQSVFGQIGYLSIGSLYIGLLTGVFEIGVTLVFALFIKTMYENAKRGIGVGVGAGTIEALLLGLSQIGNFVVLMIAQSGSNQIMSAFAQTVVTTPLMWLIGPVERTIAILCHTSSRALVLFAVAKRKYIYFWAGFLIMTGIDAIAGYVHLADLMDKISLWWVELALVPFAITSIFIIKWCVKKW